ncbi:trimeric intracellular cation channel family protein [Pelotalea chapellei]|uniref:Trimeric intracellular cation channel family protein n=1 Tax=Pelotalea chapellei TaxID=44671 RepID=A0ABS5UC15_9BACT|nr:trimeric intracellular cation channel family protein [Pelotalea chapellei]MBT1073191.1 trimeric intracellular cation channel family protein [Pelotalea chapellei]
MNLLYSLDLLGTAAFAASGALAGIRRGMDLFGVLVLGLVTATGGGTLRDLMLGDTPPFIFKDETYLYLSITVSLAVFMFRGRMYVLQHPLLYFDAVGLGTFVVIGTGKALDFKMGFVGSVMMGVMTATAGGMMRDVFSTQVPLVLQREVYASAALAGGALLYLLHHTQLSHNWVLLISAAVVIVLRLLSIRYNWSLPKASDNFIAPRE